MNLYYEIKLTNRAKKDLSFWAKNSKKTYKYIIDLIEELKVHPYRGSGFPKRLVTGKTKWGRQINEKDRLVYTVNDKTIVVDVLSARGHYDDH